MAVTDITLAPPNPHTPWPVGPQLVYTRVQWTDPWVLQPDLTCEECVWCAAPSMPTATLRWHYGRIAPTTFPAFTEVLKRSDANRVYVKVINAMQPIASEEGPTEWATRNWYGVIEVNEDLLLGETSDAAAGRIATGEQVFTAYGLEHLLDRQFVNHSFFDADDQGDIKRVERGLTFNRQGKKNRSPTEQVNSFHFAKSRETADYWTTRDIALYLLKYHTPRNATDLEFVPFELDISTPSKASAVPDWDQPVVDAEGRSVYSILCSLIPRQRLVSFYVTVAEESDPSLIDDIVVVPFTFTAVDVEAIGTNETITTNPDQVRILAPYDPTLEAEVKQSTVEKCDQVIARGKRRRSVFTVSDADGTLEKGWTATAEAEYEAGASGAAGYGSLDIDEQRRTNSEARSVQKLRNVFSRFQIPWSWNGMVFDGLGGSNDYPVFPDDTDPPVAVPQYPLELWIEPTMPLLDGVDYSADKIETNSVDEDDEDFPYYEISPICFWKIPGKSRYVRVEKVARDTPLLDSIKEEWNWSASTNVPDEDRAVRLIVSGSHQHVLDFAGFTPLPVDEELGEHKWEDCLITVSVQDDRYCEQRHPADEDLDVNLEYIRKLYIDAGDGDGKGYRLDYVVPETVVDVDDEGALVRSTGGYLHDDRVQLLAFAKIAYAWYSRERRVLYLSTEQLTNEFELGKLVVEYGEADVDSVGGHHFQINTPITEIRLSWPQGLTDSPPTAPRMRIATDAGQMDALAFVAPERRGGYDHPAFVEEFHAPRFRGTVFDAAPPVANNYRQNWDEWFAERGAE